MPTLTASQRLRHALDIVVPTTRRGGSLWSHPDLHELYPRYLTVAHTITRASVPLMTAARDVAVRLIDADPVHAPLASYLDHHIPEELHHDDWMLDDLALLGVDRDEVRRHLPSPTVAAFVGSQYFYIHHERPVAILGYLGMLEGYPPTDELCRSAAERTGYPAKAFQTLRKHAHLDLHHKQDLDEFMDRMPLSESDVRLITVNAMVTKDRAAQVTDEIVSGHPMTRLRSMA